MKLGFILALAGIAIVVGGFIWFFVLPEEEQPVPQEPTPPAPPEDPNPPVEEVPEEDIPQEPEMPAPDQPELVEELDLSKRTITALKDANIRVVAELENLDGDFEDIDGIGPAYAEEIRNALRVREE